MCDDIKNTLIHSHCRVEIGVPKLNKVARTKRKKQSFFDGIERTFGRDIKSELDFLIFVQNGKITGRGT